MNDAPLKKLNELYGVAFDGRRRGYVPPSRLNISAKLKLHKKARKDLDPVTFEVVRHALWNVNEEHGATIQRLSGSPVAMYALDLNPSILTEDAEFVYFGPYMQYMSGVTDTQVKWTLENRSDNPGIRDGDMFLANDPWVGAAHQMDVMLLCPVFWQGELFCWVTNCLHQYDIGGITPGSFCPSARDAFDEGILIPPVKIVEANEIRRDIEDVYLRSSRKPSAVALDFRAQLAGNMTARDRILALISRYGAETVKGVMRKILDDGERAFLKKLSRLPDGVWRDRTYVECCRPGDRSVHRVMLTLKKKGRKLVFENEGTAPQAGAINATYSGWRGAIMVALNELMCWEQYYAVGGALRHVEFNPTPGTLNCADFPASVSTAPVQCMEISLYPAYNVLSKMIFPDPELRRDVMCIGGTSQWPATIFRGIDQWGERYGYLLVDPIGGAIGAFSHADGISTGGQARTPICKLPNVEHTEQSFPVLFLYRKEITDSGGAGKYRGGLSAESCFIPHGTDHIVHDTLSSGNAIPTSTGMMGGYPGAVNRYRFLMGLVGGDHVEQTRPEERERDRNADGEQPRDQQTQDEDAHSVGTPTTSYDGSGTPSTAYSPAAISERSTTLTKPISETPYSHDIGIRIAGDFNMPWVCTSSHASAQSPTPMAATTREENTRTTRRSRSLGAMSIISMAMCESEVTRTPATTNVSQTRLNLASSPVHGHPSTGR